MKRSLLASMCDPGQPLKSCFSFALKRLQFGILVVFHKHGGTLYGQVLELLTIPPTRT